MPLQRTECSDAHCDGHHHTIVDEDRLAQLVALVLLQELSLARTLSTGTSAELGRQPMREEVDQIVARRLNAASVYHRDGFIFQIISWIASHQDAATGDVVTPPHVRHADKGQDGVIIHLGTGGTVACLSICEDKATENPRDTVRDEVWPELKDYESGGRDDELRSRLIAGLGGIGIAHEEAIATIRTVCWSTARRYRVRITIERTRSEGLFDGYATVVPGDTGRRRGETFHIPALRQWMDAFVLKVEAKLRASAERT